MVMTKKVAFLLIDEKLMVAFQKHFFKQIGIYCHGRFIYIYICNTKYPNPIEMYHLMANVMFERC